MTKQPSPSVFTIIHSITTAQPSISDKISFISQQYALIKLGNKQIVVLRKEEYRGVPNSLILRDRKTNKIVAKGIKAITKELTK